MCGWSFNAGWALVVLCVIGYVAAHLIAVATQYVGSPAGAAVGTAIMLFPAFFDSVSSVRRAAWRGLIVGTAAAFVFTVFAFVPEGWWGMLIGIVVWQILVADALGSAFRTNAVSGSGGNIDDGYTPH